MWERKNFDRYLRENSKINRSVGFTPQIVKYRVVRSWMDGYLKWKIPTLNRKLSRMRVCVKVKI